MRLHRVIGFLPKDAVVRTRATDYPGLSPGTLDRLINRTTEFKANTQIELVIEVPYSSAAEAAAALRCARWPQNLRRT